ncbi:MAG: hypothetical protein ACR2P0_19570 [Acidimicrobiales bacterium]
MTNTLQPQFIKQDSAVPIRLIAGGWVVSTAAAILENPIENSRLAILALAFVGGGFIALSLFGSRMWRMLIGSAAGGVAAWQGWLFGVDERLIPLLEDDPIDMLDRFTVASISFGLGILAIGLGAMLEALRAQSEPGRSPLIARIALIIIGVGVAAAVCSLADVSGGPMVAVLAAVAALFAALAWFRRELPESDFHPSP